MKQRSASWPFLLMSLGCQVPEAPASFQGVLDPELVPTPFPRYVERLEPVPPSEVLERGLSVGDASVYESQWPIGRTEMLSVLLVEPPQGDPFLYADENLDGVISLDERFDFEGDDENQRKAVLKLPSKDGIHSYYPIAVFPATTSRFGESSEERYDLPRSSRVSIRGRVSIGGVEVMVRYDNVDRQTGQVDFRSGGLGMDLDGDGRIKYGPYSAEYDFAFDEDVVFDARGHYVSTQTVDTRSRRFTLRTHPAGDYQRIVLEAGRTIPDFSYVDFAGNRRRLSDFRGKFLLLDFWGTWCSPCVANIPALKEAYSKYRSRGFEILGMDFDPHERVLPDAKALDEGLQKAKALLAEKGATWTQARTESIHHLMTKRFRISVFPTLILLDPKGEIVSFSGAEQLPLRSAELPSTLEKVLSKP